MAKTYFEINTSDFQSVSLENYDSSKFNISSLMDVVDASNGSFPDYDYFGPKPLGIARVFETSTIAGIYPFVLDQDNDIQLVFLSDNTAAATRRILLFDFNKSSFEYNYQGFITLNFPSTTSHTITGLRIINDAYDIGTVSVDDTTVTGVGTSWITDGLCAGNRIGFGSKNANNITVWYEIASINSETSITLTSSAGTIASGDYVIEDLRIVVATTNATVVNGGLFIAKGLRIELFVPNGTIIPRSNQSVPADTDNIRAVYWLKDAPTVTMTLARGVAIETRASWSEHYVYVINTGVRIYKYNIRAPLTTITTGASQNSLVAQTTNTIVTGVISGANNGRIAAPKHGPAPDVDSLYFVTTTRIYRTDLSTVINGGVTELTSTMIEVPPGGTSTYPLTNVLSAIEYDSMIDKFIITSTGSVGARSYISEFKTDSSPMEHIFLVDDKQYDQSSADSSAPVHPSISGLPFSAWSQNGILHLARVSTVALTNQMYAIPIGAHWRYADSTNQYIITPALNTSFITRFYKLTTNATNYLGEDTFSIPTEPYRIYYRTSGISDNTGSWILLNQSGDLGGITPSSLIQFKLEFKIIGTFCIPARINSLVLICEDNRTDSRYRASVSKSSISTNTFAWLQVGLWNETIPNLKVRILNSITNSLVLEDTVLNSLYGTWEYSVNGTNWLAWDSSADTIGNYVRYSANSLPSGIKVSAILTRD